jgi:hypothetical protein
MNNQASKVLFEETQIEHKKSIEKEEANSKLLQLLNKPWRLIVEGGKFGIKSIKKFFGIIALFAITNTILFFYSIVCSFSTPFTFSKLFFVLLVFLIGLGITIYSGYRAYQIVILDTLMVVYKNLTPHFQKASALIVEKAASMLKANANLKEGQLTKVIDVGQMINQHYSKSPALLRKGITMILNRIPLLKILTEIKGDILSGNKAQASVKLYTKLDEFITDTIFGNNNTKWVWWLLPLNILILVIFIKWKIG